MRAMPTMTQQPRLYDRVIEALSKGPIENDLVSVVSLSGRNCGDLSMKQSTMIGDRITDLIVTVIALGAVATFAALGFLVALTIGAPRLWLMRAK
jgi:hypothetical protein